MIKIHLISNTSLNTVNYELREFCEDFEVISTQFSTTNSGLNSMDITGHNMGVQYSVLITYKQLDK